MSEINSVGLANIILHTIKFEWQRSDAAASCRHRNQPKKFSVCGVIISVNLASRGHRNLVVQLIVITSF